MCPLNTTKIRCLKNINLKVEVGEIVALVGMSGGGKTSLVNLIPRFYDVTQGAVLIDDVDIRKTSIASLRSLIAIVDPRGLYYLMTRCAIILLTENPNTSEQKIIEAAEAAYAYDFIKRLHHGFDTPIGELGGHLSGGQKTALVHRPRAVEGCPYLDPR